MFNKRLRKMRMKQGITQQSMADKLQISLNAYQKYEQVIVDFIRTIIQRQII